jgi:hypothetical protein
MPACHAVAERNASTTLANSMSSPSPVVFTIRRRCSSIEISILKENDQRGWYPEQQSFLKEI